MPTLGQAVRALEEHLFVGRQHELSVFGQWLTETPTTPELLNVSGPGGIGKSTLLAAFRRRAEADGRPVISVDGRTVRATPAGLLKALGGGDALEPLLKRLNRTRPLIILDAYEDLAALTRYLLDEFLPRLDSAVRVVIAGRSPLRQVWSRDAAWQQIVRPLVLEALPTDQARRYLDQRGLANRPRLLAEILAATRGYPLGLSLAADLATRHGLETLEAAPEWPLVLRALVERLRELDDPHLQELLEAAALVRQFDEATLAAITGDAPDPLAFARFCRLSVVRPGPHGLILHDDVRHILAADLRWRNPERHAELRRRALAYYRQRALVASPDEQERLLAERLALWENAFVQALVYAGDDSGAVWLGPGGPDDLPEIERIWWYWVEQILPAEMSVHFDRDRVSAQVIAFVSHPAARIVMARDHDGQAVGVLVSMPVYRGSLSILRQHPDVGPLLEAYWGASALAALPERAEDATASYIFFLVHTDAEPAATRAALLRAVFGSFARGGVHFVATPIPAYKQMLEALGFERVPEIRNWAWGDQHPMDGYVLDLTRIGVEPWIEAIMAGRRPPRGLAPDELERALQGALVHWRDDAWLTRSSLWEAAPLASVVPEERASERLRQTIQDALTQARATSDTEDQASLRAVELAYLTRGVSHEAAAERLSVSRATVYRLLKRGIHGLAGQLARGCLAA